jgi:WD40 repeat protein/type II secretory pathway pseudopilin PulG
MSPEAEFDVFISYSRHDAEFARALTKQLANYVPPKGLGLPTRRLRVFRDESDIRGADYFQSIADFLQRSRKLILICSPSSRASPFVNDEVRRFIEAKGSANIIPLLLSGIPNNEAKLGQESLLAFPEALCAAIELPLAVPFRDFDAHKDSPHKGVYYSSWYTTLANIYDVSRADIEQRDKKRQNRNRVIATGSVAAIIAVLAVALIVTLQARNNEAVQREQAENSLQRASARLLTLQARDASGQSVPRTLLLSAAAVEATASQNYVEPATEEFLRDTLSQVRGQPMVAPEKGELPLLYDVSPDRSWALAGERGSHPVLWRFGVNGQVEQKVPLEAAEGSDVFQFSPNSRFLMWAESRLTAMLNSKGTGAHLTLIPLSSASQPTTFARIAMQAPSEQIERIQFSPDGRLVLFETNYPENKPAHLYRVAQDGTAIQELQLPRPDGDQDPAGIWQFSPDGAWLIALQRRGQSLMWRIHEDTVDGPHVLPSAAQLGDRLAEFSADRKWLVTHGYSSTARLWNLSDNAPARAFIDLPTGGDKTVEHVRFSPDGQWLLTSPCLWRLDRPDPSSQSNCLAVPREASGSDILEFIGDGHALMAADRWIRQDVSVWDSTVSTPSTPRLKIAGSFEVSANRRWLIEMPTAAPARIWDLYAGEIDQEKGVALTGAPVLQAAFTHDNSVLATAHSDGSIRLHALEDAQRIRTTVARTSGIPLNRLQFSEKDRWLLAQSDSDRPGFMNNSPPHLFRLAKNVPPLMSALDDSTFDTALGDRSRTEFVFSPDEDRLIARQTSSSIGYMWDLGAANLNDSRQLLKGHENHISYFDFVAGGALITSELYGFLGSGPHRMYPRVWGLGARDAQHPDANIGWARFNGKGDVLAAIGDKGTLVIYKMRTDGTLQAVFTGADLGGGIINRRPVGTYGYPERPQFLPGFDGTGRWFFAASTAGRLVAIDCTQALPKAHALSIDVGEHLFIAADARTGLLLSSAEERSNHFDLWDLSGAAPHSLGRLHLEWAAQLYSPALPEMAVGFLSKNEIAISARAKTPKTSEIWSYTVPGGVGTRLASIVIHESMSASAEGLIVSGADRVFDVRKKVEYRLDGLIAGPSDGRFVYRLSSNGRWAVGRRFTVEGYPEFGRRSWYTWRQVFDLTSRDPDKAHFTLPEPQRTDFAEFTSDSKQWVSLSNDGQLTILALPENGRAQITTQKINTHKSDDQISESWLSPGGHWLAARRGNFIQLIGLQTPLEDKLLRGFEAKPGLFSPVPLSFSPNDDLVMTGTKFWRARASADLISPVNLRQTILTASADGKWLATASNSHISLHALDVMQLARNAKVLAGRQLTGDEKEQFLLQSSATRH